MIEGIRERGRKMLPSPSLALALLALFVALGGSAVALRGRNSVHSKDIARGAVHAKDIHAGAVNPSKTSVTKFGFSAPEVSTTSGPPVTLTGGPSVTVFVPQGALVAIYAEVEMRVSAAAQHAQVHLFEPSTFSSPKILDRSAIGFGVTRTTTNSDIGVVSAVKAGWIVAAPTPGKHTFTLRYSSTGGATALFRNRKLSVTVLS
jgi:hypothetical protein